MIVAIDFHGTMSRDPQGFRMLAKLLQQRGHQCVLVTGIEDGNAYAAEIRREVGDIMPIVFAGGAWKREAAARAGFAVDVWIDDNPEYVAEQDPRRCVGARAKQLAEAGKS